MKYLSRESSLWPYLAILHRQPLDGMNSSTSERENNSEESISSSDLYIYGGRCSLVYSTLEDTSQSIDKEIG